MRRHALSTAAVLVSLFSAFSAPTAHAAPPGLALPPLHVDVLVGEVVMPLAGTALVSLEGLPPVVLPPGFEGLVPTLVYDVALPLVGTIIGGGLPALPGLEGLQVVVPGVVSGVVMPTVGGVLGTGH